MSPRASWHSPPAAALPPRSRSPSTRGQPWAGRPGTRRGEPRRAAVRSARGTGGRGRSALAGRARSPRPRTSWSPPRLEQRSQWEELGGARRIVTYTRLSIDRPVAGQPDGEIWVRTLGGAVGDIGQQVSGDAQLKIGAPGDGLRVQGGLGPGRVRDGPGPLPRRRRRGQAEGRRRAPRGASPCGGWPRAPTAGPSCPGRAPRSRRASSSWARRSTRRSTR